jgi:hypothetical protein
MSFNQVKESGHPEEVTSKDLINNSIDFKLGVEFEEGKTMEDYRVITVELGPELFERIARAEITELDRITRYASNVKMPELDTMIRYMSSLLHIRCAFGRMERPYVTASLVRNYLIPARFGLLLAQIGKVIIRDQKFKFIPKSRVVATNLMTVQELRDFSDELESFSDEYALIKGMAFDPQGAPQFMTKAAAIAMLDSQGIESDKDDKAVKVGDDIHSASEGFTVRSFNHIRGMSQTHPVYAFFSYLLQSTITDGAYEGIDWVYRVKYSSFDTYDTLIQSAWKTIQ